MASDRQRQCIRFVEVAGLTVLEHKTRGWSDVFLQKMHNNMHQHATFFLFLIFICFLLANQSLRIFGHKLKAVTSPCLFVQAVTSNFAFSGGGVGEAIREELFKAGSCGSWD